ncbi:hypothetical protein [Paenibacillus sp.]|uniref:hypothetical protein n=1 Tax=Paenibacillus sp. TaxID=58172 RepID=UPI002D554A34|nr:hypothetical protein [Paenibacillus sp.]HZG84939.1 hypothetical protein [Paenibacillus sp.]
MLKKTTVDVVDVLDSLGIAIEKWYEYNKGDLGFAKPIPLIRPADAERPPVPCKDAV